jgi:hypothetical protein
LIINFDIQELDMFINSHKLFIVYLAIDFQFAIAQQGCGLPSSTNEPPHHSIEEETPHDSL